MMKKKRRRRRKKRRKKKRKMMMMMMMIKGVLILYPFLFSIFVLPAELLGNTLNFF